MSPLRSQLKTCLSKTDRAPQHFELILVRRSFNDLRECGQPVWSRSSSHCLGGRGSRSGRKVAPLLLRVCFPLCPSHRALSQWLFHLWGSRCRSRFQQLSARQSQSLTPRGLFLAIALLFSQRVCWDTSFERVWVFCLLVLFADQFCRCFQSLRRH